MHPQLSVHTPGPHSPRLCAVGGWAVLPPASTHCPSQQVPTPNAWLFPHCLPLHVLTPSGMPCSCPVAVLVLHAALAGAHPSVLPCLARACCRAWRWCCATAHRARCAPTCLDSPLARVHALWSPMLAHWGGHTLGGGGGRLAVGLMLVRCGHHRACRALTCSPILGSRLLSPRAHLCSAARAHSPWGWGSPHLLAHVLVHIHGSR